MLNTQFSIRKSRQWVCLLVAMVCFAGMAGAQQSAAAFKLPAYEKMVLSNGLTVYLMEQHEVPLISVSVVLPAGAVYDGAQAGLSRLTADALLTGTARMTKQQIEEALDFVGAKVETFSSKEQAGLEAKFAAKDRAQVLGIIRDVLLTPRFDTAEFAKARRLLRSELAQAKESPRNVIGGYWDAVMYNGHPYANPTSGREATVSVLTAAEAARFYKARYVPNGSAIAVVGDFNKAEMKKTLTGLFGGWKKGVQTLSPAIAPGVAIAKPTEPRVLLVNKDDARETTFYIGGPGVPRNNPDYVAMEVINTLFGGRFTSWLNDELRVNTGLTYGARSAFSRYRDAGTFQISTFTATKNTEAAIDKALEVLKRLHTQGIDEKTLTSAKNYVKGQFPPRYETVEQLSGLLTQMYWYGFDEGFINGFQKSVDELTPERAKAIVVKYFPKDALQFVLVGKASEIKKIAAKYGKVTEVDIKVDAVKAF